MNFVGTVTGDAINDGELTTDTLKGAAADQALGIVADRVGTFVDDVPTVATALGVAASKAVLTVTSTPEESPDVEQPKEEE